MHSTKVVAEKYVYCCIYDKLNVKHRIISVKWVSFHFGVFTVVAAVSPQHWAKISVIEMIESSCSSAFLSDCKK